MSHNQVRPFYRSLDPSLAGQVVFHWLSIATQQKIKTILKSSTNPSYASARIYPREGFTGLRFAWSWLFSSPLWGLRCGVRSFAARTIRVPHPCAAWVGTHEPNSSEGSRRLQPFCPGGTADTSPGQAQRSPGNHAPPALSPVGATRSRERSRQAPQRKIFRTRYLLKRGPANCTV